MGEERKKMAQRREVKVNVNERGEDKGSELSSRFRDTLSQLHEQGLELQKLCYLAGEKNSLTKLYQWVLAKLREGQPVSVTAIMAYLEKELLPNSRAQLPLVWSTGSSSSADPELSQHNDGSAHGSADAKMETSTKETGH